MNVRTRIAPSPTGIAHVGTIYTALLNYAFAKGKLGKFILRIEDTDRERYVPGSEQVIYSSFRWLGIRYDEGPDIGGSYGPYTQSQRLDLYQKHARRLLATAKAYYCFCTPERLAAMRQAQQQAGQLPRYDGTCRRIDPHKAKQRAVNERYVIRLKAPKLGNTGWNDLIRKRITVENATIDDQVLLKSDGYPTYHLAVVVDDHAMRISHVIRAEEWIPSTPKHILLFRAFGWKLPQFAHTPLLRNPDRTKLSKRRHPVSVMWYKEHGFLPEALLNYLCLMGWSHPEAKEVFTLEEFVRHFSLERTQTTQPVFDIEKLRWLNGRYIRDLKGEQLAKYLRPFLPKGASQGLTLRILPLIKERLHTLSEFNEYAQFFFEDCEPKKQEILRQSQHSERDTRSMLTRYIALIEKLSPERFTASRLEGGGRSLLGDDWNAKQLFMAVRVAVTGRVISPPLFESMVILGMKETLERLRHAVIILKEKNDTPT